MVSRANQADRYVGARLPEWRIMPDLGKQQMADLFLGMSLSGHPQMRTV